MATVVISLWARLTTRVRSLAVTKGTGGCKESGGGTVGEERRGRFSALAGVGMWPPWGGGVVDRSGLVFLSLPGPPLAATEWTRPIGGGAQRHQTHPSCETPPPLTRPLP